MTMSRTYGLLFLSALVAGCGDNADPMPPAQPPPALVCKDSFGTTAGSSPADPAWQPTPDVGNPVSARFQIRINPKDPVLKSQWLQPHPEAMTVTGDTPDLQLVGGVKPFALHPERLFVEVNLVSSKREGLAGVTATVSNVQGSTKFYDLNQDPLAAPVPSGQPMPVGGIGPQGTSTRLRFGFETTTLDEISFELQVAGKTTIRTAQNSAPLAVTPDGRELWATMADSDVVAVLDTTSDTRLAQLPVVGRPSSIAVTPDGELVLVTGAACNQLAVIDRKSRTIVQLFGEAEGIGRDPRHVVLSPDGSRAYVSAYVGDSVTVLERLGSRFRIGRAIPVGRRPVGLSVMPDGKTVYVAHFMPRGGIKNNAGWVSVIDADTQKEVASAEVLDDANLKEAECLAQIAAFKGSPASQLTFEAVPTQFAGVFLTPGGGEAWVPGLRTAGFPVFEGDLSSIGFSALTKGANSPSISFPLDTREPLRPAFRKVGSVVDFVDRDESFLKCVLATDDSEGVTQFPGSSPDEIRAPGVTIPSVSTLLDALGVVRFVAYTKGGRLALFLSYLSDQLAVLDTATHSPTSVHHIGLKGSNPIGLAVTPDGKKGYVSYENSTFVSVLDLSDTADDKKLPTPFTVPYRMPPGNPAQGATIVTFVDLTRNVKGVPDQPPIREKAQVALVDKDPMDPIMRRGKILFTSSNPKKYPTLSGSPQAACAACHPNGGNDGSAWSTMEGERRTIGLWGGTAKRGWLHASGTHASAHDFASIIVPDRLGGTGLSKEDVHALSLYVARGIPVLQPPRVDTQLASEGRALFTSKCASCHSGPDYGSGRPDKTEYGDGAPAGPGLYDIGSATDWASVALGEPYTRLFPPGPRKIFQALRGDRALGTGDVVQSTLKFSPRPDRSRSQFRASPLVNVWENVVFFHDAHIDSLDAAVREKARLLNQPLSDHEVAALVEYLKTL